MIYLKYFDDEDDEFGIWELSDDLEMQRCIYYSNGDDMVGGWIPTDEMFSPGWCDLAYVDVLTKEQVEEEIFFNY